MSISFCSQFHRTSLLLALCAIAPAKAATELPWASLDIDRIGPEALQALKQDPAIQHWTELGDRLIVRAESSWLDEWSTRKQLKLLSPGDQALFAEPLVHCDALAPGQAHADKASQDGIEGGWRIGTLDSPLPEHAKVLQHRQVLSYQLANRAPLVGKQAPRLLALAERVSSARWQSGDQQLASFDRLSANGFSAALDWVENELRLAGLEPVSTSFGFPPHLTLIGSGGRNRNIAALQPGSGDGLVIVGAHLDSRNEAFDATRRSPGAEDNASGCSAVVETARVLADQTFDASVLYICFGMEEVGLIGSAAHAAGVDAAQVRAMINLDMIAFDGDGRLDFELEGTAGAEPLLNQLAVNAALYTTLEPVVSLTTCCSDHMSYDARGIPSALLISNDFSSYGAYHTSGDLPSGLTPRQAGEAIKLVVTSVAELAGAGIRSDLNGYWYDPSQAGQGLHFEVQQDGQLLATWYTFDAEGRRFWLIANGPLSDNHAVLEAFSASGGAFPPAFDPTQVATQPWGQLEIRFDSCQQAELSWQALDTTGFPAGRLTLQRLSQPIGGHCTSAR